MRYIIHIILGSAFLLLSACAVGPENAGGAPVAEQQRAQETTVLGKTGEVCGDGACLGDETCGSCPGDCGACACGDGSCAVDEGVASCPADCSELCGDKICGPGENDYSCAKDCGCSATACGLKSVTSLCSCEANCADSALGCCYDVAWCG